MDPLDESVVARWVAPVFIFCSLVLIPWIVYLGLSLPTRQLSRHYDIAWFDVLTSPRHQVFGSIALAVFIEIPLACVCGWLSYHTERLAERRIRLRPRALRRR